MNPNSVDASVGTANEMKSSSHSRKVDSNCSTIRQSERCTAHRKCLIRSLIRLNSSGWRRISLRSFYWSGRLLLHQVRNFAVIRQFVAKPFPSANRFGYFQKCSLWTWMAMNWFTVSKVKCATVRLEPKCIWSIRQSCSWFWLVQKMILRSTFCEAKKSKTRQFGYNFSSWVFRSVGDGSRNQLIFVVPFTVWREYGSITVRDRRRWPILHAWHRIWNGDTETSHR